MILASGGTAALDLLVAALLVVANGFFVASEFALARVRESQVDEWVEEGRPGALSVRSAVNRIDEYLAATQLGITVASLGLGALGEPAFHELLEPLLGDSAKIGSVGIASLLAFAVITTLHVVVGELAPKSAAIARTSKMVLLLMPILRIFYLVTRPLVRLFNGMGNLLLKPFGIPPASEAATAGFTQRELIQIIRESGEGGLINPNERRLTESAFEFDDRRVHEVMVPRRKAITIDVNETVKSAAHKAVETGVTRLPLCDGDHGLDDAIGVIHAKDLLASLLDDPRRPLTELTRPVLRILDTRYVDSVLREMRRERQHLAIVIDEHGTAVGIATVEDVIEELVGEIEDEFDPVVVELIREDGDSLLVDGEAPISSLLARLDLEVDSDEIHEATVGGHLMETLGRLPSPGEELELFDHQIEIDDVADGRVRMIRVLETAELEIVDEEHQLRRVADEKPAAEGSEQFEDDTV